MFNDIHNNTDTDLPFFALIALPSPPTDVRLTSIMNNSESASVTIEWDPPSQGGSPLNYTTTTIPDLISGPPPITTSTSTTITINYNTDYTITITAYNCIGNGSTSDELQFNFGLFHYCLKDRTPFNPL